MEKHKNLKEFIEENATPVDHCYYYDNYSKEIQESMENIYNTCWRFGLYKSQTIYMLNEAIEPLNKNKDLDEVLGVLE